ncbi:hypothetical protein E3O45_09400 [Cryobacterium sp. TMS1-20-1]|nr:hypothetical protein E3O45_09400 [Cryobacterium sp. TMS1-20-1]
MPVPRSCAPSAVLRRRASSPCNAGRKRSLRTNGSFSSLSFPELSAKTDVDQAALDHARGHAAGYTEGLRAAAVEVAAQAEFARAEQRAALADIDEQLATRVAALAVASRAVSATVFPILSEAESMLIVAAVDLAEAVLATELASTGFDGARQALDRVLNDLENIEYADLHTVRMHPADLADIEPKDRLATGVTFIADSALARGDAIAEFPDGILDARIGTAFARVKSVLLAGLP